MTDLDNVSRRIGEGDPDPTLIEDQEYLIREMNAHPECPSSKTR